MLANRPVQPPELGTVLELPQVGGLHHRYERRAALAGRQRIPAWNKFLTCVLIYPFSWNDPAGYFFRPGSRWHLFRRFSGRQRDTLAQCQRNAHSHVPICVLAFPITPVSVRVTAQASREKQKTDPLGPPLPIKLTNSSSRTAARPRFPASPPDGSTACFPRGRPR